MIPPGIESSRLLCLLDLSWWLSRAWYVALREALGGADPATATDRQHRIAATKTIALVTGWLVRLLSPPAPACVAVALDSMGPTWRHKKTEALPEERRYKAGRQARPEAYHRAANTVIEIVQLHAIPVFSVEGSEADDCLAAAVARARDEGLDVAIVSADKDIGALVTTRPAPRVVQWPWCGHEGADDVRGWAEIEARYGVSPWALQSWLAIVGDQADNVRGADGIGEEWAARILLAEAQSADPLEGCFRLMPDEPSEELVGAARNEIARIKRKKVNPFDDRSVERLTAKLAEAQRRLDLLNEKRAMARALRKLQAQREQVMFSYELVKLDADCPIVWRPEELPVGGFDAKALSALYKDLGFHGLAAEVRTSPKRNIIAITGGT